MADFPPPTTSSSRCSLSRPCLPAQRLPFVTDRQGLLRPPSDPNVDTLKYRTGLIYITAVTKNNKIFPFTRRKMSENKNAGAARTRNDGRFMRPKNGLDIDGKLNASFSTGQSCHVRANVVAA